MKPKHVQNTAVKPSWRQLWRELNCSVFGHVFYVAWGGHYLGMPQSHCYRCGKLDPHGGTGPEWCEPIG
jgi:hypothetical protein